MRKIRKELGVTMVQLQKHSGVSQPYISQLENGRRTPTKEAIKNLVHGLAFSDTGYIGSIEEDKLLKRLNEANEKDSLESISEGAQQLVEQLDLDQSAVKTLNNFLLKTLDSVEDQFIKLEEVYSKKPDWYFTVAGEPLSETEKEALTILIKGIKSNRRKPN
nr:helix-turn-helix transcriptional regulator [Enterococcus xiangfangensis]